MKAKLNTTKRNINIEIKCNTAMKNKFKLKLEYVKVWNAIKAEQRRETKHINETKKKKMEFEIGNESCSKIEANEIAIRKQK